jgi:hypothetical protein
MTAAASREVKNLNSSLLASGSRAVVKIPAQISFFV